MTVNDTALAARFALAKTLRRKREPWRSTTSTGAIR